MDSVSFQKKLIIQLSEYQRIKENSKIIQRNSQEIIINNASGKKIGVINSIVLLENFTNTNESCYFVIIIPNFQKYRFAIMYFHQFYLIN